jgi:integrase
VGHCPQYLLRDRDASYGRRFRQRVEAMGAKEIITASRSLWQNAYLDRVIGSIRRQCLDSIVIINHCHLRRVLYSYFQGDRKVRDITADRITAYQASGLEGAQCLRCDGTRRVESSSCTRCHGTGKVIPANSTVNYELTVLRGGFRLGIRAAKVGSRPEFAMLHVSNARKGFFEREQYEAVLRHLPDYLKPVAAVAYITGWRTKSEILTRQWRHVDFDAGWLGLDPGETKNGEGRV